MTDNDLGIGERAERERTRKYWRTLTLIGVFGLPAGAIIGFGLGRGDTDVGSLFASLPTWVSLTIIWLSLIGFCWGTWAFAQSVDEVEMQDNLWGSTASFYLYALLLPTWWAMWKTGVVGKPNDWAIFLAALAGGLLAYGWRKWRAR